MNPSITQRFLVLGRAFAIAFLGLTWLARTTPQAAQQPVAQPPPATQPRPVRNDVPKPGRELLVLRNHQLQKGGHDAFYRFSRDRYWPYFERLGARVVGQWKLIDPAPKPSDDREDIYRLVRYASFEHWQMTRGTQQVSLAGNGPAFENGQQGVQDRGNLELGSKGAYFLEGEMAPDGPLHMPGLNEQYELVSSGDRSPTSRSEIAVRLDAAQPGDEVVVLHYQRIQKGAFDRFVGMTRSAIGPFEAKLGASRGVTPCRRESGGFRQLDRAFIHPIVLMIDHRSR